MYTTNTKHEAMKIEALRDILETLENGYTGYYCDLHNEVFNSDYYIIGRNHAREVLNEYDVFEAIWLVQTYERDNFGEVTTDISEPEKLINMVYYIVGEEVISELTIASDEFNDAWNDYADEETNAAVIETIKDTLAYYEAV